MQHNVDKEHVAAFMIGKTKAAMFEKETSTILDRLKENFLWKYIFNCNQSIRS